MPHSPLLPPFSPLLVFLSLTVPGWAQDGSAAANPPAGRPAQIQAAAIRSFEELTAFAAQLAAVPFPVVEKSVSEGPSSLFDLTGTVEPGTGPESALWPENQGRFSAAPLFPAKEAESLKIWLVAPPPSKNPPTPVQMIPAFFPAIADLLKDKSPAGFGGIRLQTSLENNAARSPWWEWSNEQGERGSAPGLVFGLTSRPLAILQADAAEPRYLHFQHLWLVQPDPEHRLMEVWGLVDSPELVGAVKYRIMPGVETAMSVECQVTPRKADFRLGIATAQAYYSHSEAQRTAAAHDARPEAHEADGVLLQLGEQESLWRTFAPGTQAHHLAYSVETFRGYGLMQRDRKPESYFDHQNAWERMASWFMEPVGKWSAGRLRVTESPIPAPQASEQGVATISGSPPDSTSPLKSTLRRNIHLCWQLDEPPVVGSTKRYQWRAHWNSGLNQPRLASVTQSRTASAKAAVNGSEMVQMTYITEFANPNAESAKPPTAEELHTFIEIDRHGLLLGKSLAALPNGRGFRVTIHAAYPAETTFSEIGCVLLLKGRPFSEKWHHIWKK